MLMALRVEPTQFGGWNWAEKLIGTKVEAYSTHSTIWRPRPAAQPTVVVSSAAVAIVKTTKTTLTLKAQENDFIGSPGWIRTSDHSINSRMLYR
jgi:hypothetical protein